MNTQELLNTLKIVGSTLFGILAMHGYMTTDQASAIMGDLTVAVPALLSLGTVAWSIYSHWNMKKVPENSVAVQPIAGSVPTDLQHGEHVSVTVLGSPSVAAKVVGALLFAFLLSAVLIPSAFAQTKPRLNLPIDPLHLNSTGGSPPSKPGACDITLFANLNLSTVVQDIKNCIGSVVAGGAVPFVNDLTASLKSATDSKDGIAMACYTPALAIAVAAQGTPASADGSTPAIYPGPILIFQKAREFVNAGGISNCKTTVQSTAAAMTASAL